MIRAASLALGTPAVASSCKSSAPQPARRSVFLAPMFRPFLRLIGGGIATSSATLLPGAAHASSSSSSSSLIADVLKDPKFPETWPFDKEAMQRYDETSDFFFYSQPRFVTHIDDSAIGALTKYYATVFPPSGTAGTKLLDICSSWISHYPPDYTATKISGLGMNESELKRNPILTDYAVRDLNEDPTLPYDDDTFDVVTNAVSIDYLTRPVEVLKEAARVLKPGGVAIMSFSNRCFPTKAVSIWTSTGDIDHIWIVGAYFHYSKSFEAPDAKDISPAPGKSDPMYVVFAKKPMRA